MRRVAVFVLGLTACGPESVADAPSSTGDTGTAGVDPTTGGEPTTGEAACLELDYPVDDGSVRDPRWRLGCGFPVLCTGDDAVVFTVTGELGAPTAVEVSSLERARCMVTALRERTLGGFNFVVVEDTSVRGVASLEIVDDTAAVARWSPQSCTLLGPCEVHEALHPLRRPTVFDACVAGDAIALWQCLYDAADVACLPGPLPCR